MGFLLLLLYVLAVFLVSTLIVEVVNGILGFLLCRISYRKHPFWHRLGIRFLAMSPFLCRFVPRRCQMCCGVDNCRNHTCPGYRASNFYSVK